MLGTAVTQIFTAFTDRVSQLYGSGICGDIDYALTTTGSFLTLNSVTRTLTLQSDQATDAGTYTASVQGSLVDYPSQESIAISFQVKIDPCVITQFRPDTYNAITGTA